MKKLIALMAIAGASVCFADATEPPSNLYDLTTSDAGSVFSTSSQHKWYPGAKEAQMVVCWSDLQSDGSDACDVNYAHNLIEWCVGFRREWGDYVIDYIMMDRAHRDAFRVDGAWLVEERKASDHAPLVVKIAPARTK